MIWLKKQIKSVLANAAFASGLLQRYLSRRLQGRAVVLMYHRVLPDSDRAASYSADGITVSPATFRRQMQLVRKLLRPMTVDDLALALKCGSIPDRSCLVTFDDGWFDNHAYALPILQELGVPAVVFVATDYVGTNHCFWQERLSRMLFHAGQLDDAAAAAIAAAVGTQLRLPQIRSDRMAIRSIIDGLKHQPASHIDAVLLNVETLLGKSGVVVTDNHPDRFMSWKQAAALRDSGMVTIGSHCCSHTPLTKLRLPEVEAELTTSRRIIGELAGATPCSLAYPNGDCSNEIAHATAAAGYAVAFSTERGYVSTADNPQQLRRINVHEHSTDSDGTFLARIAMLH